MSTSEALATYTNDEQGIESRVMSTARDSFIVLLRDTDANETLPTGLVFADFERADLEARRLVGLAEVVFHCTTDASAQARGATEQRLRAAIGEHVSYTVVPTMAKDRSGERFTDYLVVIQHKPADVLHAPYATALDAMAAKVEMIGSHEDPPNDLADLDDAPDDLNVPIAFDSTGPDDFGF